MQREPQREGATGRAFTAVTGFAARSRLRMTQAWRLARWLVDRDEHALAQAWEDYQRLLRPLRRRLRRVFGDSLATRALVDFGCGYRYPMVCLLGPAVGAIVGVDVCPMHQDDAVPRPRRRGGARAALMQLVEHDATRRLHRDIASLVGPPSNEQPYTTLRSNGRAIPLPAGYADAIVSNAVIQELPLPLEPFAREMARVLGPGGYIDLEWHNFHSLSGNYGDLTLRRADPWGHLLGRPVDPCLNRVLPDQVVAAFRPWFRDLRLLAHDALHRVEGEDDGYEPEGQDLLTPALRARLARYPRSLLLTRGYVLVGRRRSDV